MYVGLDMSNHMYPLESGDYVALHHIQEGVVGHYLMINTLSSDGKVIHESDTIVTEFVDSDWGHDYHQNHFKVIRTADGTIYKMDHYVPGAHLTDSPPQAAIVIYDTAYRKRIIEVPDIIDKTQVKAWLLRRLEDRTLLIETVNFGESGNYYLIDIETGELLRRTHIRSDHGESVVPYIRRTGEIYYPSAGYEDGYCYLDIIRSVHDTLRPRPRFQIADAGFTFNPSWMHPLLDGSFLITGVYHSFVNDVFAGTFSDEMLVTPEMLGLVPTSVADQVVDQDDLLLYPSLAYDVLYITDSRRHIDDVVIINSTGQATRQTVTDARIDVTSLEPGITWLLLLDGSSSRAFVKI